MTTQEIACKIARETQKQARTARECGRQGDVIMQRIGDATPAPVTPFAALVGAGTHGEHWIISESGGAVISRTDDGCTVSLPWGGVIVHTDRPEARHAAIQLLPGVWEFIGERELSLEGSVVRVAD